MKEHIVFPSLHKVIFVHGCFWHQHSGCAEGRVPGTRQQYWIPKLQKNCECDRSNRSRLRKMGWRSLVIWECDLKNETKLTRKLTQFLGD
jgi:DNA mismatch endonuclease (patch repair protein)